MKTDPITRAQRLNLHGLIAHLPELTDAAWVERLLDWEENERAQRSQERRLHSAKLGRFKSMVDFDWAWPKQCDRAAIDALLRLEFMAHAGNAVLIGPNGVGKTTLARNIAHQAVIAGHTVLFTTAAAMLGDLAGQDGDLALKRRLNHYIRPSLLLIDLC